MREQILERFIAKSRSGLYKFVLSNVKNPEVAEDLTQDILFGLTRQYRKSTEILNLKSYLFTTAKNHIINYWKKAAVNTVLKEQYWSDIKQNQAIHSNPCIDLDKEVIFDQLEDKLTDQQRKIFFLNRREGLSYSEISKELNISKSTVKNHMILALKTIRDFMDKNYDKLIGILVLVSTYCG